MRHEIELHFSRLESKLTRIKLVFRTQDTLRFVEQHFKKVVLKNVYLGKPIFMTAIKYR